MAYFSTLTESWKAMTLLVKCRHLWANPDPYDSICSWSGGWLMPLNDKDKTSDPQGSTCIPDAGMFPVNQLDPLRSVHIAAGQRPSRSLFATCCDY
jgi:hypothetical protein